MTPAQLLTLRAALLAATDPAIVAARDARNDTEVARLCNLPSMFYAYRTAITRGEIYKGTPPEGSAWDWNVYRLQSASEQGAWLEMFEGDGGNTADFSQPNIRAGVDKIFQGSGAVAAQRLHVANMAKRLATVAEAMLATGVGTAQAPGDFTFQGIVTVDDVGRALNG